MNVCMCVCSINVFNGSNIRIIMYREFFFGYKYIENIGSLGT